MLSSDDRILVDNAVNEEVDGRLKYDVERRVGGGGGVGWRVSRVWRGGWKVSLVFLEGFKSF